MRARGGRIRCERSDLAIGRDGITGCFWGQTRGTVRRVSHSKAGTQRVLLTFTGFHDPFSGSSIDGSDEAGPVLTVASEVGFDAIHLFSTPNTDEVSEKTHAELTHRFPSASVSTIPIPVKDPTNYLEILKHLRAHYAKIAKKHDGAEFYISVSSGTPQMHACWMMPPASTLANDLAALISATYPEFVRISNH